MNLSPSSESHPPKYSAFDALVVPTLLVAACFALFVAYAYLIPNWQPYDEPLHYNYIAILATEHRMPTGHETTEAHQPPLYYRLMALGLHGDPNRESVCLDMRVVSSLFGLFAVLAVFAALKTLLADSRGAALLTFAAFNIPALLACLASITNDSAAVLLVSVAFLAMVRARGRTGAIPHILLGAFCGLALLSKGTCLFLVPVILLFYALDVAPLKSRIRNCVLCFAAVAAVAGWWYIPNIIRYGDPTGSGAMLKFFPRNRANLLDPREAVRWAALLFDHFWNFKDYLRDYVPNYPFSIRVFQLILSLVPVLAVVALARKRSLRSVTPFAWVSLFSLLVLVAEMYANSFRVYMPTGRFIFPAIVPLAFLWRRGLGALLPEKHAALVTLLAAAALLVFNIYLLAAVISPLPPMPMKPPFY